MRFKSYLTESFLFEMKHLRDIFTKDGEEFFRALLNEHIAINVKVDQVAFVVQRNGDKLAFKGREGKGEINKIKRAGVDLYEKAIAHIEKQPWQQLPDEYEVFLETFVDNFPSTIRYSTPPKSGLILSYVKDDAGTILRPDLPINKHIASLLNVSPPPILFSGKLTDDQKQKIISYVSYPEQHKIHSFLDFIMQLFVHGPDLKWLHETGYEGVVFYFGNTNISAKLVDPLFTAAIVDKKQEKVASDWTVKFKDTIFRLVVDNIDQAVKQFEKLPEFSETKNSETLYINFVSYLVKYVLDTFGEELVREFAPYEKHVVNSRYSGISWGLIPNYIKVLDKKYWFTQDVFSAILFLLQKPKRVDIKGGITPERKKTINEIIHGLKEKGINRGIF